METSAEGLAASYRYDPFGNTMSSSGTLAAANVYRFSSKEIHVNTLMYCYLYRFYDPNTQRWLNRDPIAEDSFRHAKQRASRRPSKGHLRRLASGDNLYEFAKNSPQLWVDRSGLDIWVGNRPFGPIDHWNINVGNPNGSYASYSFQGWFLDWYGEIYNDTPPASFDKCRYLYTTPDQDKEAKRILDQMVGDSMHYSVLNNTCETFSCDMFNFFANQFPDAEWYFEPAPSPNPPDWRGWRGGDL